MIENVIRIIVDGSGNVIDQPTSNDTIRALNNAVDKIVMIAPFPVENWASVSFLRYNATPLEQYLYSRAAPVSNYVESNETFSGYTYHDIADWTVYEADIKSTALAYISKHRNGSILISLANGELAINSKCITFQGTFGIDSPLPTGGQTLGDYYMCEDYLFNMADNGNGRAYVFGKGQYVYWNGSYWVKVLLQKKIGTATIEISVDPSYAVGYELDDDDINYLATIGADVVLIDGRVTVLEGFKTDIDNGDYELDSVTFKANNSQGDILKERSLYYDSGELLPRFLNDDGTDLLIGGELQKYVDNDNGDLIEGHVVYINGAKGQRTTVDLYDITNPASHGGVPAVITQPNGITSTAKGKITFFGEITVPLANLENSGVAYAEGQPLYVSVNSKITNVVVAKPNLHVHAGTIERIVGQTARIFLDFFVIPHLDHLSDVDDTGLVTGDNLQYNQSTKIWSRDGRTTELVASKGQPNGIATLDGSGKVPTAQLPSYVDDVIEVATYADLPVTGETGKIYVVIADETQGGDTSTYRWTGSVYALISNSLTAVDVKTLYESNANTNAYTDSDKAKVDFITVTQAVDLDTMESDIATNQTDIIALETKEAEQDKRLNELDEVARKIAYGETSASVNDTEIIALPKNTANGQLKPQIEGMTLQATQLVTNGDFDLGNANWTLNNATGSVTSGVYSFTATAINGSLRQNVVLNPNEKYYINSKTRVTGTPIRIISSDDTFYTTIIATHSGGGAYEVLSGVFATPVTVDNTKTRFEVRDSRASTWTQIDVDYYYTFNISTLIANKTYSPLYDTTFDLMSDAQIKAQMDLWVSNGTLPNDNIQSVSGNLRLNAVGKNLLDTSDIKPIGTFIVLSGSEYIFQLGTTARTSNAIKVEPLTNYILSGGNRQIWRFEDVNNNYVGGANATSITTPANAYYAYVYYDVDGTALNTAQLEVGTVATTYEPYQNSEMFIEANDLLNRVPNGTKDTIEWRNGKLYYIQRNKEYTLQASDITTVSNRTNSQRVLIQLPSNALAGTNSGVIDNKTIFPNRIEGVYDTLETGSLNNIGYFYEENKFIGLYNDLGTYANLATAQADLAGTKIIYQLATPIETEVKTVGQILGSSKGTVYVEKAMRDVDMYSTQFDISNTSYPIASLIKVIKLVNGGELELDVNDATIAVDGLSFTHTGLSSGDFAYIVYAYDLDNTIYGTTRITYYNSDLVRISPDGTVYKLDWSVDNAGAITFFTSEVL